MFFVVSLLVSFISFIAGVYTLKNWTSRLFTKAKLPEGEVRNQAIRRIGILYIGSSVGLMLVTILYYITPMGTQPFVLFFGIFGALVLLLRIDLNSY